MLGKVKLNLAFMILLSLLMGCADDNEGNTMETEEQIKGGDLSLLKKLIKLPDDAYEIKWEAKEDSSGGLTSLSVFFRLPEVGYNTAVTNSIAFDTPIKDSQVSIQVVESWFPQELKSKFSTVQNGEAYILKDVETKSANDFVIGGMSPFVNGQLTLLGDGYLLLQMYTM